jgi:hypothetical protein
MLTVRFWQLVRALGWSRARQRLREEEEEEALAIQRRELERLLEKNRREQEDEERLLHAFDEYTRTGIPPPSNSWIKNPNKYDDAWFCDGSFFAEDGTIICNRNGEPYAYFSDLTHTFHSYKTGAMLFYYDVFRESLWPAKLPRPTPQRA